MINIYKVVFRLDSWMVSASKGCFVVAPDISQIEDTIKCRYADPGESVIIVDLELVNGADKVCLDERVFK